MPEYKPLIIVVSAPSGSGKTTIVSGLLEHVAGIKRSVSYTTRQPRENERDGEDYIFIPVEEFRKKIKNSEFIEWEENFGNYYGTSRQQILEAREEGADIVLSIDVRGAEKIRREFPETVSIFIMPPSFEELKSRLASRNTDSGEVINRRLEGAEREIKAADDFDYMIVNDKLEEAVEEIIMIVGKERNIRKQTKG
jgi:guanylate kinase